MTLPVGTHIASYEIRALLGTGGMGEVYRAHDARLKRDVAIKRLPEAFSRDADRVLRFQREAEILARVNHPNIAGIYDLLESDGARFLVLELVEGATLADRLRDGPIAPPQALRIARQICEALEAAHSQGIVHRDLKPANIALSPDDAVKVLDFGLAKSIDKSSALASGAFTGADPSQSPTIMASVGRTDVGTIMGTAAYMSPEQARGGPVDARTDVFSYGCVLYEMLAGSRAFPGDTVSDVMAAILRSEPEFARLPRGLDRRVRSLLTRALAKNPRDRWQAIGDLRYEIEQVIAHPGGPLADDNTARRSSRIAWGVSAAVAVSTLVIGSLWLTGRPDTRAGAQPVLQLSFEPPDGTEFDGHFELSPDGSRIAFNTKTPSGESSLYIRSVHEAAARRIEGTTGGRSLFWSPDGRWLGYFEAQKLKKVRADGGAPQIVADAPRPGGATWNRDDVILFVGDAGPVMKVAAAGGTPTPLSQTHALDPRAPSFLPDGVHFVFTALTSPRKAYVGSIASDELVELPSIQSRVVVGPRHLLFVEGGRLLAQAFNLQTRRLEGQPSEIARGVAFSGGGPTLLSAATDTGILVFNRGDNLDFSRMVWFDRTGQPVGSIGGPEPVSNFRLSPDQSQLVLDVVDATTGRRDLWLVDDLATGIKRRLTADTGRIALNPVWAPDGRKLLFSYLTNNPTVASGRRTLVLKDLATSTEEIIADDTTAINSDWTAAGALVQYLRSERNDYDIRLLSMPGARNPTWFLKTAFDEGSARVSPNGQWIAYPSNESGSLEVYVQSFPKPGFKRRVSNSGGHWPRWRGDGAELFYKAPDGSIMSVPMGDPRSIAPRAPVRLFRDPAGPSLPAIGTTEPFAASLDGQRFLLLTPAQTSKNLSVIVNWPRLLNAEAGAAAR